MLTQNSTHICLLKYHCFPRCTEQVLIPPDVHKQIKTCLNTAVFPIVKPTVSTHVFFAVQTIQQYYRFVQTFVYDNCNRSRR